MDYSPKGRKESDTTEHTHARIHMIILPSKHKWKKERNGVFQPNRMYILFLI